MDGGFGVGLHPHHHHLNGGGGGARKYHCKMCPQVINNFALFIYYLGQIPNSH